MKKNKKYIFSIIIPIYNVEKYLEEAILSVVNQSLSFEENVQLILVNDGSYDNSDIICKKYIKLYPNNVIYISKKNGGVSSARNAGLEVSTGKYINFLDSDDYFSDNVLFEVEKFFETNKDKTDVVAVNLINFENSEGSWVNGEYFKKTQLIDMKEDGNFMQCQVGASFIKEEIAKKYRFDTEMKIHEDSHYLYRIFCQKPICGLISNATYWHRIRSNGTSATQNIKDKINIFSLTEKLFKGLIDFYLKNNKRIPDFLQTFIILEFNYYVVKKINECKFTKTEKHELKQMFVYILDNIDSKNIEEHYFLSKLEKDNLLKVKKDIYILFKKEKITKKFFNFIKKSKIYFVFKFIKKILLWLPKKITNRVLYNVYRRLDLIEFNYGISKFKIDCLENKIDEDKKYIVDVEKDLWSNKKNNDQFKSVFSEHSYMLENKIWEYNYTENIILYEFEKIIKQNKVSLNRDFNPLVSIVIPVYNGSNYMKEAIDSAISQTYKNIEIIVVNDGSTDNGETERIAKSYGNKIRYFSKENGGVSTALNFGIKQMKGDYFSWLSHDDLYWPDHLEKHIDHLRIFGTEKIITFSNFNIVDENSNEKYKQTVICGLHCYNFKLNKIKPEYSLLQGEINGGNILIPKESFEICGFFNEKLRISQEREMWSRLMKFYTFVNIPYITTSIREHSNQVTNTNKSILNESNKIKLKIIDNLDEKIILKLENNKYDFYQVMEEYFTRQGLSFLQNEMKNRKKQIKSF